MDKTTLKPIVRLSYNDWLHLYQPLIDEDNTLRRIAVDDIEKQRYVLDKKCLWTEYDDDRIENGRHFVNRFAYIETRFAAPENVLILVEDVYEIDIVNQYGMVVNNHPYTNLNYREAYDMGQHYANEYAVPLTVVFANGERDDILIEPESEGESDETD